MARLCDIHVDTYIADVTAIIEPPGGERYKMRVEINLDDRRSRAYRQKPRPTRWLTLSPARTLRSYGLLKTFEAHLCTNGHGHDPKYPSAPVPEGKQDGQPITASDLGPANQAEPGSLPGHFGKSRALFEEKATAALAQTAETQITMVIKRKANSYVRIKGQRKRSQETGGATEEATT